jgi:glycosyltransferase involved in cell wall biosynthesis
MARITAVLHTENDALRLGRALETVYACDDILVVDHGSRDATVRVAREYGAHVVDAVPGASARYYLRRIHPDVVANPGWILCLAPRESLSEKLAASLFEWKLESSPVKGSAGAGFSMLLREETEAGWVEVPVAETRLVPHTWNDWKGAFPVNEPSAITLEGELLRFAFP